MLTVSPVSLGSAFRPVIARASITATPSLFVPGDPARVAIYFLSSPTISYWVRPGPMSAGDNGILVAVSSDGVLITYHDLPGLIGMEWFARSTGAGAPVEALLTSFIQKEE